ncbi:MAG: hypothetical protein WBD74_08940 [Candidatus Aquilonibacter sp.]
MLALLLAAALASPVPTNPPICPQYFHEACSEATGKWLPQFATPDMFWDSATHITQRDSFPQSPSSGTLVVFTVELQKAHVIYDGAHRRVFYETGCCSWNEVVLSYAGAPPKPLANRDLSLLKTTRGVQLGMSPLDVVRIYGTALQQRIARTNLTVFAYTTWPPRNELSKTRSECGQFENFYFQGETLVLIQLGNGC